MTIQVYCAHGILPCIHIFISTDIQFLKLHINVHHESVQVRSTLSSPGQTVRARAPGTGAAILIGLNSECIGALPELSNLTR